MMTGLPLRSSWSRRKTLVARWLTSMASLRLLRSILLPVNFSIWIFICFISSFQKRKDCVAVFYAGNVHAPNCFWSLRISLSLVMPSHVNTLMSASLCSRNGESSIIFAPMVERITGQTSTGTTRSPSFEVSYQPEFTRTGMASAAVMSSVGAKRHM